MPRRLFHTPPATADIRPALMSIVALMILLLPVLLMATSAQKLAGLPLSVPGPADLLPPPPPGPVESLRVQRQADGSGFVVTAEVRRTDVGSSAGDTEQTTLSVADLPALQGQLRALKEIDPERRRIRLQPSAGTPTEEVVRMMDAVRADARGELFPNIVLETEP